MKFYAPTKVYLEKNCVKNHRNELSALGSRAFIVTGSHSSKINGSLNDVVSVLEDASIPYQIYQDIEENPSVETVTKAAAAGKKFGADFVIGIGGGSPLDASKAIALLIANPGESSDCLYEPKNLKALPIAAVPTTCGTGSEITPNAVLTRHDFKTKKSISYHLYPDVAFIDGSYLASAKGSLLLHTAVDALAHCVESRLHSKANIFNHMFSEYGLRLWGELLPSLTAIASAENNRLQNVSGAPLSSGTCKNSTSENSICGDSVYEKLMLTSAVAGMAIAQTTTSLPHALSYEITYNYGVPHGKACGIFLAAYMEEYAANRPADTDRVLSLLGFSSIDSFAQCLRNLLGTVSISQQDVSLYADNIIANTSKLATYPFTVTRDAIVKIIEKSVDITA